MGELSLHPSSAMWWQEKKKDVLLPHLLPSASGKRTDLAPQHLQPLGKKALHLLWATVELTLLMGVQGSWSQECKCEISGPTIYLPYGGMGREEKLPHPSTHPSRLWQVRKLSLRS